MTLQFEYVRTIPGTNIKAEMHKMGSGWWRYFLTNQDNGEMSAVEEFHLPDWDDITYDQAAKVAFAIWLSHKLETQ